MGDNYCDFINNRAFCNYDGGDCCASTVKTKKVGLPAPFFTLSSPYQVSAPDLGKTSLYSWPPGDLGVLVGNALSPQRVYLQVVQFKMLLPFDVYVLPIIACLKPF